MLLSLSNWTCAAPSIAIISLFALVSLCLSSGVTASPQPCSGVCYNSARLAYRACWGRGRRLSHCHVIRCLQDDPTRLYRGWACANRSVSDASPRPSPSPHSVSIPRGCRAICRTSASVAWDDCLYNNRTVAGCIVLRCETDQLPYRGWICAPISTNTPSPSSPITTPIPSPTPFLAMDTVTPGRRATCFTDPHCRTFDGLEFDCQASGEFTLVRCATHGLDIQARFRGSETSGTVTKGVVVRHAGAPLLQLTMAFSPDSASEQVNNCPVLFHVDREARNLTAWTATANASVTVVDDYSIAMEYASGLRVDMSVWNSPTFGCYFEFLSVFFPEKMIKKAGSQITGLLGSPNHDPYDDWTTNNGEKLTPPSGFEEAVFKRAYDYCTTNWCVSEEAQSLFTYERSTTFRDFARCSMPYGEPPNFADASSELLSLCGVDNACLVDGLVGDLADARVALRAQVAADEAASLVFPFRFDPPVVPAGQSVSIRVTVDVSRQPDALLNGLRGFAVYRINGTNGEQLSDDAQVILVDDGSAVSSDPFANDGIYSNDLAVRVNMAGESLSYRAVPVFEAGGEDRSSALVLSSLSAVRAYSEVSGLGHSGANESFFSLPISAINDTELLVRYSWPMDQYDLDTATTFLEGVVGFSCSPSTAFLTFGGDVTMSGGTETAIIRVGAALKAGRWTDRTKIIFRAGWFTAAEGQGPATIRTVLRYDVSTANNQAEIPGSGLKVAIDPAEQNSCAQHIVAELDVKRSPDEESMIFTMTTL